MLKVRNNNSYCKIQSQTKKLNQNHFSAIKINNEITTFGSNLKPTKSILKSVYSFLNQAIESSFINCKNTFKQFSSPKLDLSKVDNIEGYLKLNNSDKNKIRELFKKEVIGKSIAAYDKSIKHPFQSEADLKELMRFSRIVAHSFKNSRVLAIGRSPLWFLETLKMMKGSKVNLDNYSEIAVSGLRSANFFCENEIKAFGKYLNNANLSPEQIIEYSTKTGQKTVLFDFLFSGKGMVHVIDLMDNVLKQNYKNNKANIKSKYKSPEEALNAFHNSIKVTGMYFKSHKPTVLTQGVESKLYQVDQKLSVNFFDHLFRDDLGVEFNIPDWEYINPLAVKPSDRARLSRFMLIDQLFDKDLLKEAKKH